MFNSHIFIIILIAIFFSTRGLVVAGSIVKNDAAHKTPANRVESFVTRQLAAGIKANHLISEKSPYLLQHAFNPVDWYPWGDEAFARARKEGKPIFLSIGYSTCHWCHVMARESFADPEVAALLNKYFIAIKVDREERPDLDKIYMTVTHMLAGSGGWPMSVFLTPDLQPFYAGTYFPLKAAYGRPGFIDLLGSINENWQYNRSNIINSADKITAHLRQLVGGSNQVGGIIENESAAKAFKQLKASYDPLNGGFGRHPKFPRPVIFDFLLAYQFKSDDNKGLDMVINTLSKMAAGGIYDQLGGGFHRYSVDEKWLVPHFEKMLYDQALLISSYLAAYQLSGQIAFADTARQSLDYILRDMTSPQGGFYSAEDADSPLPEDHDRHGEGAFYLWPAEEIIEVLGLEAAAIFNYQYGVRSGGNVKNDPQDEFRDKNILHRQRTNADTAKNFNNSTDNIENILTAARKKLLASRNKRPRPGLDDKVLVSWNGLQISALAQGYQVMGDERYLAAASKAANFILAEMYIADKGRLLHRYRRGGAGLAAQLADYTYFVQGLLDLYEASFDLRWLDMAISLTKEQIDAFHDPINGGFYETNGDDKSVLVRMKEDYDGAEPAANSLAVLNLARLSNFTGKKDWYDLAVSTANVFAKQINAAPTAMPKMLAAVSFLAAKPMQIVITGDRNEQVVRDLIAEVNKNYHPHKIIMAVGDADQQVYLGNLLPFIKDLDITKAAVYVCEDFVCKLPAYTPEELAAILR